MRLKAIGKIEDCNLSLEYSSIKVHRLDQRHLMHVMFARRIEKCRFFCNIR